MPHADIKCCILKSLPDSQLIPAAAQAVLVNPLNHPAIGPPVGPVRRLVDDNHGLHPARIAILTTKYWGLGGVHLTVGFMDGAPADLQARILSHANAWGKAANVKFSPTRTDPQVRITRIPGGGYWSFLGTDILSIPANEPTMNLDSFTMNTPDSEFLRVPPHEFGHSIGLPHEHMRPEIVENIIPQRANQYFSATQGWSLQEIRQQVLTPLNPDDFLIQSPQAETDSIMCYQLPGSIMKDGKPVPGGTDITADDYAFVGLVYPILIA